MEAYILTEGRKEALWTGGEMPAEKFRALAREGLAKTNPDGLREWQRQGAPVATEDESFALDARLAQEKQDAGAAEAERRALRVAGIRADVLRGGAK